jgi:hypothetical protein
MLRAAFLTPACKEHSMPIKDRFLSLLVCAVFGLIGGSVTSFVLLRGTNAKADQASSSTAQQFKVVDKDGHVRAVLGVDESGSGSAGLRLYHENGKKSLALDTASLHLYDKNERARISIGLWDGDTPEMIMRKSDGGIKWQSK